MEAIDTPRHARRAPVCQDRPRLVGTSHTDAALAMPRAQQRRRPGQRAEQLAPTQTLAAAVGQLGVRPLWLAAAGLGQYNSMASYMHGLRQPQAALAWLELTMAGDTRRHTPHFAAVSSLHLGTILHALDRHVAAMDVLEGCLRLIETELATRQRQVEFLLLRAVAEHNMAVQLLVLDRPPAAVETCERAIATTRGYVAASRALRQDPESGEAGDELRLCASQMECTWLAAARLCEQPEQLRHTSALRDSRASLLALAPLATPGGRRRQSSAAAETTRRDRSPSRGAPTTPYAKHRRRLAAIEPTVDSGLSSSSSSFMATAPVTQNRIRAAWQ